jgi:hypothetical protein
VSETLLVRFELNNNSIYLDSQFQPLDFSSTSKQIPSDWLADQLIAMKEVAFYCKECDFLSSKYTLIDSLTITLSKVL